MPCRQPTHGYRCTLSETQVIRQQHQVIGVAVNDLSMGPANAPKDPITLAKPGDARADRVNGPRDLHAHDKWQLLTAVVPGAHTRLGKVDAACTHANPDVPGCEVPEVK